MVSPAVTASSPSRIGAIGMPAGWPAEAGWPVPARSEGTALAVAADDGADSRRAFNRDRLTARVANECRADLPGELILGHHAGRAELEDEAVIAVVMRHADGG